MYFQKLKILKNLLKKKSAENGVITVPGAAFGQNGKNHVRMSYANSYENIVKAMDIFRKGVN